MLRRGSSSYVCFVTHGKLLVYWSHLLWTLSPHQLTVERWKIKKLNNYTIPERLVRLLRDNWEEKKDTFFRRRMKNFFGLLWIGMGRTAKERRSKYGPRGGRRLKEKKSNILVVLGTLLKMGLLWTLFYTNLVKKRGLITWQEVRFLNCFRQCFTYELQLQPCKHRIRFHLPVLN